MSQTSIKPEFARANGPNCIGCIEEKADVMLTFGFGTNFTDVFLDRRMANSFHEELGRVLSSIDFTRVPEATEDDEELRRTVSDLKAEVTRLGDHIKKLENSRPTRQQILDAGGIVAGPYVGSRPAPTIG